MKALTREAYEGSLVKSISGFTTVSARGLYSLVPRGDECIWVVGTGVVAV